MVNACHARQDALGKYSCTGCYGLKNPVNESLVFHRVGKGRQQFAIKRTVGENIFNYGYCVAAYAVSPEMHREQGPIWEYILENTNDVFERFGGHVKMPGEGPLREIPEDVRQELKNIFDVTGGTELFNTIEKHSKKKAAELGLDFSDQGIDNEYFIEVFTANRKKHTI